MMQCLYTYMSVSHHRNVAINYRHRMVVTHTGDAYDTLVNLKLTLRDTQRKLHDAINAGVAGLDSVKGET